MAALLCLGLGYCARHYAVEFGGRFECIVGTTRTAERAEALSAQRFGGRAIEMLVFDGHSAAAATLGRDCARRRALDLGRAGREW